MMINNSLSAIERPSIETKGKKSFFLLEIIAINLPCSHLYLGRRRVILGDENHSLIAGT